MLRAAMSLLKAMKRPEPHSWMVIPNHWKKVQPTRRKFFFVPEMYDKMVQVHRGNNYVPVKVTKYHIGRQMGDFVGTTLRFINKQGKSAARKGEKLNAQALRKSRKHKNVGPWGKARREALAKLPAKLAKTPWWES
eukprot:RCo028428